MEETNRPEQIVSPSVKLRTFTNLTPFVSLTSNSPQETESIAGLLAEAVFPGSFVALAGDLGTGKTCFARGFIQGKGLSKSIPVTSPTFIVVNTYDTETPVYHFDWYRVSDIDELETIGYRDYLGAGGICIVEWPEQAPDAIPAHALLVHLTGTGTTRRIDFYSTLPKSEQQIVADALATCPIYNASSEAAPQTREAKLM